MVASQAQTTIDWKDLTDFTPKQQAAAESMYSHRYILYGGARGGGKSRFLRWSLVEYLIYLFQECNVSGAKVMLACETYPELQYRQISKIQLEMPSWLGDLRDSQADGLRFKLAEGLGSGMICLRNLDKPAKYQSAEFAAVAVDELTKIQKTTFDILRGSLRWPGVSHTLFMGATNPGGAGHGWVKALWIDRKFPPEMMPMANDFKFIQSLPADNPHLDKSYWDELNSLPEQLRKAWVNGDWNVFQGMAFPQWSADHICNDFDIPSHWPRTVGIDWGYANPFAAVWIATEPDTGRVYLYREAYKSGLTDPTQARLIKELSGDESIRTYYADPSMWATKSQQDVITSTADIYRENGVLLAPGDNDRLSGKRKIDTLLGNLPDGRPGFQVFRSCTNFTRTLPVLSYDLTRVEDVDTKQEDHIFDALKYALTRKQKQSQQAPAKPHPLMGLKGKGIF